MGRKKQLQRRKRQRRKKMKPDRVFSDGLMTIAQYGKMMFMQSNWDEADHDKIMADFAAQRPATVQRIQNNVQIVRKIVAKTNPLDLMRWAYWLANVARADKLAESKLSSDELIHGIHFSEYIQSVIVSTALKPPFESFSDEKINDLTKSITEIYMDCSFAFLVADDAVESQTTTFDIDFAHIRAKAQMSYLMIRGDRYPIHDLEFLEDFLAPHSLILEEEFGFSAATLLNNIRKIQENETLGVQKLLDKKYLFSKRFNDYLETINIYEISHEKVFEQFLTQGNNCAEYESMLDDAFGTSLFDLQKITDLPKEFLEELSLEPGSDETFFGYDEKAGWPLKVLPIRRKPFLKYSGQFFHFQTHALYDEFYRALQRVIIKRRPQYSQRWNELQKEVSERRPLEIIKELLPDSEIFNSIYYKTQTGQQKQANWCEVDGIVIANEILFVIEVKSGAFTWTSPEDDFEAHLRSLKSLVENPSKQAERFISTLKENTEISLCDETYRELFSIKKKDFSHIIPICITLDSLSTWAHELKALSEIGIHPSPAICFSLDELRIYRDVFKHSSIFLYYLYLRFTAEQKEYAHVNDELDYLGLFLTYGNFLEVMKQHFDAYNVPVRGWPKFKDEIDKFFQGKFLGEPVKDLDMPFTEMFKEFASKVYSSKKQGRLDCLFSLLNIPKPEQVQFERNIKTKLFKSKKLGNSVDGLFFTLGDNQQPFVIVCNHSDAMQQRTYEEKKDVAYSWMMRSGNSLCILLDITGTEVTPVLSSWNIVALSELKGNRRTDIKNRNDEIARRVRGRAKEEKLGRNDLCLCGSGIKFKTCCGHL